VSAGDLLMQGAAHVVVQGLTWNGAGIINLTDTDHGRISRFRIQRTETGTDWLTVYGKSDHCRVDHNDFGPQNQVGNMVIVNGPHDEVGNGSLAQNTRIDHNYFHDVHFGGGNGWETIRSGVDMLAFQSTFSVIEQNLFVKDANDPEVISLKSSDNTVRYNTLRNSAGQFVLRGGNRDLIYGNFVLGDGAGGSLGLRVSGGNHRIFNNYIEGVRGGSGIFLEGGTSDDKTGVINEHKQVYGTEVVFNTVIDSGGIQVGGSHPLDPVNCTVAYNLVQGPGALYRVTGSSKNITVTGNLASMGTAAINGVTMVDPKLMKVGDVFTIPATSPAVNAGLATFPYVTSDIEGKPRADGKPDVGAVEVSPATPKFGLLTEADVGPMAP
jgi:hypothetical protein